jgi:ATP-dependent Zn protease
MKRKWTAYHEAGHSVAAAVLDILRSDIFVSIVPDGRGEYGFVTGQKAFDFKKRSPRYIRKMILSYHAGPAVSKKLSPQINLFEGGT